MHTPALLSPHPSSCHATPRHRYCRRPCTLLQTAPGTAHSGERLLCPDEESYSARRSALYSELPHCGARTCPGLELRFPPTMNAGTPEELKHWSRWLYLSVTHLTGGNQQRTGVSRFSDLAARKYHAVRAATRPDDLPRPLYQLTLRTSTEAGKAAELITCARPPSAPIKAPKAAMDARWRTV